jgi:hypothetical protein
MKTFLFILMTFLTSCSYYPAENPDIKKVQNNETLNCTFHDNIQWELEHGVSAADLIKSLHACKNPRFKRGEILVEKDDKNCTFQIYGTDPVYPDRLKNGEKIQSLYLGKENCNGLIDEDHSNLESNLLIRHKR